MNVEGVAENDKDESDSDESEVARAVALDSISDYESDTTLTDSEIESDYKHVQHAT